MARGIGNWLFRAAIAVSSALRRLSDGLGRAAVRWLASGQAEPGEQEGAGEIPSPAETRELSELRREMLSGVLEIGETVAREVMVPRTDMVCVEAGLSLEEVRAAAVESEHSRIPVYEGRIDNIVGVLYTKDLLKIWQQAPQGFSLRSIIRPAYFIPETKPLAALLREFQRNRVHMAIVVDEYGGVAGLVTLEDILEQITGEIEDEYDVAEDRVVKLEGGEMLLDARMDIESVEELLGNRIEKEDFESLGGMVITMLGHLPLVGEGFTHQGWRFSVEKATDRKVVKVRVRRLEDGDNYSSG